MPLAITLEAMDMAPSGAAVAPAVGSVSWRVTCIPIEGSTALCAGTLVLPSWCVII